MVECEKSLGSLGASEKVPFYQRTSAQLKSQSGVWLAREDNEN